MNICEANEVNFQLWSPVWTFTIQAAARLYQRIWNLLTTVVTCYSKCALKLRKFATSNNLNNMIFACSDASSYNVPRKQFGNNRCLLDLICQYSRCCHSADMSSRTACLKVTVLMPKRIRISFDMSALVHIFVMTMSS